MRDMLTESPVVQEMLIFDHLDLHELLSLRKTNKEICKKVSNYIRDNLGQLLASTSRDGLVEFASISPAHTSAVVNNQQAVQNLGYNGLIDITYFGRDYQAALIRSNVISSDDKRMILNNIRQRVTNVEESRSNDYKRS